MFPQLQAQAPRGMRVHPPVTRNCFSVPTGVSLHVTLRAPPLCPAHHVDGFSAVKNTFIPVPVLLFKKLFWIIYLLAALHSLHDLSSPTRD